MLIKDDATRKYLYGIVAAAGFVALIYGFVDQDQLNAIEKLGAAILGISNTLAFVNTSKGRHEA